MVYKITRVVKGESFTIYDSQLLRNLGESRAFCNYKVKAVKYNNAHM